MKGRAFGAFLWLAAATFNCVLLSGAPLQWTIHPIPPVGTNSPPQLYDVAFGNDRFVAVGGGGIYSAGGSEPTAWTRLALIRDAELRRIKFAEDRFLVVGQGFGGGGFLLNSMDGTNWERKDFSSARDVAYGNGWFVVVGDELVARSTNLVDWIVQTNFVSSQPHRFGSVDFVNGEFLATFIGERSEVQPHLPYIPKQLAVSKDGANWAEHPLHRGEGYVEIAYGRKKYVSLGLTDYIPGGWPYVSDDGRSWTDSHYPVSFDGYAIEYANGVFGVVGWDGRDAVSTFMSSMDGVNWESFEVAPGKNFYGMTFGRGRFVAVGYKYGDTNGVVAVSDFVGPVRQVSNWTVSGEAIAFDFNADAKTVWDVEVSEDLLNWSVVKEIEGTSAGVERVSVWRSQGGAAGFVRLREKR